MIMILLISETDHDHELTRRKNPQFSWNIRIPTGSIRMMLKLIIKISALYVCIIKVMRNRNTTTILCTILSTLENVFIRFLIFGLAL